MTRQNDEKTTTKGLNKSGESQSVRRDGVWTSAVSADALIIINNKSV